MVTIEEIKKAYDVDMTGVIKSPGKFGGEKIYSPYFFEFYLNGFGGDEIMVDDVLYNCFEIDSDDLKQFPDELMGVFGVIMWQNSQGFIFCKAFNEKEYRNNVSKLESDSEKEFAKL